MVAIVGHQQSTQRKRNNNTNEGRTHMKTVSDNRTKKFFNKYIKWETTSFG